ncbi:MAG: bifunctional phosphoribosylaminoimidazolecarboxamide formyltransferase/IMP cyclohydrolase, partial [Gammaproteobacteria bacterium]|nr:bifunctional phosphoribosylaminoimidazolecarboxamide formyltransferase/IMP cyclohydrolase [Gammaproteobacteria bacterium]
MVSLSNKTNIDKLAALFQEFNIEVISTGGTAKQLKQHLPEVIDIEEITSFPEILGGRVKTLHPHVHGGILARKDNTDDMQTLKDLQIDAFDLVVVNLYPFEEQLLKDGTAGDSQAIDSMVELIDIGGITLLRAAAKNYRNVILITDPQDYDNLADELRANNGSVRVEFSAKRMAAAFARSSAYDRNIANYFAAQLDQDASVATPESAPDDNSTASASPRLMISADLKQELRYGENPHQQAALYASSANHGNDKGIAGAKLLNGKALSYNNLVDANAAWRLACE